MLRFITYFCLLVLCSSFQRDKYMILWQEDKPLAWDDFMGKPEPRFAAASTSYDILKTVGPEENKTVNVSIEAVFFKYRSWKKKNWVNDEVLAHEQKHFDIVELYARKLRKTISETSFKNYNQLVSKIDELYDSNDKAMDKYQDLYDDETDGSMNGDQQRAWQKKIMAEIKALDKYKETNLEIKLP